MCQYYDGNPTSCRFGAQCRYAHGQHELRGQPQQQQQQQQQQPFFQPPPPIHPPQPIQAQQAGFPTPPAPLLTTTPFFPSFPGLGAWRPVPAATSSRPPPREFRQREYTVVKLGAGFEVTHEIKFSDATAATQFFVRALKQDSQEAIVSKFVSANLVFAATATQGVFLTGLQYHVGKKVVDELSGVSGTSGAEEGGAAPKQQDVYGNGL